MGTTDLNDTILNFIADIDSIRRRKLPPKETAKNLIHLIDNVSGCLTHILYETERRQQNGQD